MKVFFVYFVASGVNLRGIWLLSGSLTIALFQKSMLLQLPTPEHFVLLKHVRTGCPQPIVLECNVFFFNHASSRIEAVLVFKFCLFYLHGQGTGGKHLSVQPST